jgi:SSS family solute:Na+ symporter
MKILILLVYIGLLLGVGIYSMRKVSNMNDFFLGSRGIGPWVSAFAYGTSYFSAVLFIGYAGKIGWGFGLSSLWIVFGNAFIGCFLAWKVLGKRTREITHRLNVMTMPEFLSRRYDSKAMKIVTAIIIFIFLVPYSASVYMGLSYLFEQIFQIPFALSMAIMAGITGVYLLLGGYRAVAITDFIQGIIMILGVILLIFFVLRSPQVGGLGEGIARLQAIDPQLIQPVGPPGLLPLISLVVLTSLGSWGLPQMVQKFYTIKNEKVIPVATVVSSVFALVVAFGAYFTGSFGRLFFPGGMPTLKGVPNPDLIMPQIIGITLPQLVAVIIMLLVLSASMSTLASLVLVSSSTIVIDLGKEVFPQISEKKSVIAMRILCLMFIALSLYIALKPTIILTLMALSWGTVSGTLLAPYLYGLYFKRTTRAGAWAGMIAGFTISIGASIFFKMDAGLIPTIGSAAMVIPLFIVPLVSFFTAPLPEEHLNAVFGIEKPKAAPILNPKGVFADDLG